jgi:putative membrane protein
MSDNHDISAVRLARSLTFLALSFFISWLAQNGKLSTLVHPRMNLWIEGAGVLFLVLAFVQMLRLSQRPRRSDPISFFVPIIFVVAITFIFVTSGTLAPADLAANDDSLAVENAIITKRNNAAAKASIEPLPATIQFDDDRYWTIYNRLYDDPVAASGHKVVIQGFFRHTKSMPQGTALIARNLMWCCSADMSEIGLVAKGPDLERLKNSTWVEASGRLSTISYDFSGSGKKSEIPLLVLDSLKPVDKGATSGVIFPF